jgi:hypothetical protein
MFIASASRRRFERRNKEKRKDVEGPNVVGVGKLR